MGAPVKPIMGLEARGPGLSKFIALALAMSRGVTIRAGIVDDGKGAEATDKRGDMTNAAIGIQHEFGNPAAGIRQRPFIAPTWQRERAAWGRFFGERIGDVLRGKLSVLQAFNQTGALMASDIKKTIVGGSPIPPPNAPSVLARKQDKGAGIVRTLVDIGSMLGSISWRVVGAGNG